ncbi:acyl-CoA dehydrogenase family protein [Nocardioides marmoribigeumensis]|uniref:acyl-CoA dehydrogenase family protein n=1 Tax=Nocardioides marmoribigeumensis TaxID=433649 RepID=UPI0031CF7D0F
MDFTPTDGQDDTRSLAAQVFSGRCTNERQQQVEAGGDRFDRELWAEAGSLGLLGIPLPEEHGGAGLGVLELATLLVEAGRVIAPLPLPTHLASARVLAEAGTAEQQATWLPDAAAGDSVRLAAVAEDGVVVPEVPVTTARRTDAGWQLDGTKTTVPAGTVAGLFLVPAATDEGTRVFLVRPDDGGVTVTSQRLSDGDVAGRVELSGALVGDDRLLGDSATVTRLLALLTLADCAWQQGVCEGALALTSSYARTREQFGRPIGTFQAVSQRLADGYIEVQGLGLTVTHAAWLLDQGREATVEVATAKLWAADAGHKLAHTTVHVHGGVGIDLDGEAHRFFTAAKRAELAYGGTTLQARTVGRALAAEPV